MKSNTNMSKWSLISCIIIQSVLSAPIEPIWKIENTCHIPHFFTQGLEVLPGGKQLLISAGWYKFSKVSLLDFKIPEIPGENEKEISECEFKEIDKYPLADNYFGEGATRI